MKPQVELFRDYQSFKEFVEQWDETDVLNIHMSSNDSPTGSSWWAIVIAYDMDAT